jgi:rsbT antagonist protein RsbS
MPNPKNPTFHQPPLVSILRQGGYLIASIHTALDDTQLQRFQHDLIDQVGQYRARGVIIDVAALDIVDSYATHTLRNLARMAGLRGASTVIVGINPDVAYTMVRLGLNLNTVHTALDLDEGLAVLNKATGDDRSRRGLTQRGQTTAR